MASRGSALQVLKQAWNPLGERIQELRLWMGRRDTLEIIGPLTLILVLLFSGSWDETRALLQVGAVAGLVYRPLQRAPLFWMTLAAIMALYCVVYWHDADNHKYLITYWCLAVGLSCTSDNIGQALRVNGRLLVGLCFLAAVIWKLWTPDFLTGEFYQHAMLTDERIARAAQLLAGLQGSTFNANLEAVSSLTAYSSPLEQVVLDGPPFVRRLSKGMVVWTLAIEWGVVLTFLWPWSSSWTATGRDVSLLVFVVTTYALANVGGFAWILLVMGLAQVQSDRADWRLAYLGTLLLIVMYQVGPLDYLLLWMG